MFVCSPRLKGKEAILEGNMISFGGSGRCGLSLADGQGLREGDRGVQKAFEVMAWMSASEASGDRCAGQSPSML